LNPGSNGGPLIHLKSKKVIGINTLGYSRAEGMSFALALKSIHEFLKHNEINY
jgi:S1-C subfamily serine protease